MSGVAHELSSVRLGDQIAAARRSIGLTQRELADALGISSWAVERMEAGEANATRHLSTIADVTKKHREWFLGSATAGADASAVTATVTKGSELVHLGSAGRSLVIGSLVVLVTIRFFTEVVPVVPRAANFIDIAVFAALAAAAMAVPLDGRQRPTYLQVGLPAFAFVLLSIASATVNAHRTALAPVLVFVYGFIAPLAVYAAAYRIWPPGSARSMSRALVGLGLFELAIVAVVDLPRFHSSGNPDLISGTFGTNAYQLVFFLLIVATLLAGVFTLEPRRAVARFAPPAILGIFAVVLLAQYRALLATTVLGMVVVGVLLGRRARGIVVGVLAVAAFGLAFSYVASSFPGLRLKTTASTLLESPWSYARERYKGTSPVTHLYQDDPFVGAIGTGPATFSSRAWQTFANSGSRSRSNVVGGYAPALTGGTYRTDVSEKYLRPQLQSASVVDGSRAVSSPYSSYLALAAELGLLGLALVAGVYCAALYRSGRLALMTIARADGEDPVPALALATTIGFLTLIQMGFLENWLEVTRVTFVVWLMLAVVSKELDSRSPVLL